MLWLLYLWVVHTPNNSPVSDLGILICMFCVCGCVCWQCLLLHLPTSPKEGKSWNDAQSICSSFQGSLVAIEDEIEQGRVLVNCTTMRQWFAAQSLPEKTNSFISTFFSCHVIISVAFITMFLQGSAVGVWIGLRDEDTMKWTNGRPVSYTNWSPVEPKNPLNVSCRKYLKFTLLTARTASIFVIYELVTVWICRKYLAFCPVRA